MLQCQCIKIPVITGKGDELKSWISGLADRSQEVLEALNAEGIHDEAVFYSNEPDGEYLYLYSRAASLASAGAAFQASNLPLDLEFKQVLSTCLDFSRAAPLGLLFAADMKSGHVM